MALSRVSGPDCEPVTIGEAKAHLRLDITDDDELLSGYILAARSWVEGQTHRALAGQTWDYSIDFAWPYKFGRQWIELPLSPVQSVTSITYIDSGGVERTLAAGDYQAICRTNSSYIVPAYGKTFPAVRGQPAAITVRFVAGYAEAPSELKQAIMLLAGHFYENREAASAKALIEVPLTVEAMISPYRSATV